MMKMKLISVLLFFSFLFVLPEVASAKTDPGRFSERDRDPSFVCREVKDPKTSGELKKGVLDFEPKEKYYGGADDGQKTLVVFASFSGQKVSDTSKEEEKAEESLSLLEKYLNEMSRGKMQKLTWDIRSGWVELSKTPEEYGSGNANDFDAKTVFNEIKSAIDGETELSRYARVIIFMEGNYGFAMASQGKWDIESDEGELPLSICWIWTNNISDKWKIRHEFLHTIGLRHAGGIVLKNNDDFCERLCQNITEGEDGGWPPVECTAYPYWNEEDIMGGGSSWTSIANIYWLGWLDKTQVYTPKESGVITLIPRSSSSEGFKMLLIEGEDDEGSKITFHAEYCAKVEGTFDYTSAPQVILYYSNGGKEIINTDSTLLFKEKKEEEGETAYSPLNLKETPFCDSRNGIKIELISENGNEAELYITLEKSSTPTPSPAPSPTPTQTPSPTLPPIPTPSLNPTLPPVPTPGPTVPAEEMNLSVTINGIDATTNSIVVARKSWVEVRVEASEPGGKMLQADKITCKMTKSNGKVVFKSRQNGIFRFKAGRIGRYSLEIEASKEGYQPASFQASFKAR